MRHLERKLNELRPVEIIPNYIKNTDGSILISCGDTKIICTATIENRVPPFLRGQNSGWLACEYSLLPFATKQRVARESVRGKQNGRTLEIQRLIGRSLRAAVDLELLGSRTIIIDCDVIQADGGTRTTSITGAMVALELAIEKLMREDKIAKSPLKYNVAATSVGVLNGEVILDLDFEEDSTSLVDMNVVMNDAGEFIEIQGTAEGTPYTHEQLMKMLELAKNGITKLIQIQNDVCIKALIQGVAENLKS